MSHRQPDVLDRERLKEIQENMIRMCSVNQKQVFAISEKTRGEYEKIAKDLERIKQRVAETMAKHDRLERQARFARSRVVELKEKVDDENEELQQAIEHANEIQIEISVERQAESQLRKKRDELERRLMHLKETLDQAEMLAGQVSVILKYLNGEIKNLADVLETAQQKQELGLKIIEAQEEERRRLSREIHDGPAQTLAHVLLSSEIVKKVFQEKGEEAAYHELENLKNMIRAALQDVRRIIYDLRPMALEEMGLVPTIKKYLRRMEGQGKLAIRFRKIGNERRLPEKLEAAIFRIVQEAVQNVVKHSQATEAKVRLEYAREWISLLVRDNGQGFDLNEKKDGAFGLLGMQERVEVLNGTFSIDSGKGRGTAVFIQIPVHV